MAVLSKGTTITSTTTVTAQTLHDLIEAAVIGSVVPGDIEGSPKFYRTLNGTAPNPSDYPFWYDSNPEDPVFRVYAAPWNIWLAVGPHRIEVPLLNSAATALAQGALVVAGSAPSSFNIATNPSLNAIGFLQASTASGAYGPVAITGIGYVLWASGVSGSYVQPIAQQVLHARNVPAGCVQGNNQAVASGFSRSGFGVMLDRQRSGTSFSFSPFRALIWGPRVGHQGGNW